MAGETLSVLHVASFKGNTGDLLNHIVFRPWFDRLVPRAVSWHELEIRGYYRRHWKFDESFFDLVNSHDLLVIGGGNFFELWPQRSRSGTSVDLIVEDFEKIRIPVFFNSLGVDAGQGISPNAYAEFPRLIAHLTLSETTLVSVRNDGAIQQVTDLCGEDAAIQVIDLPDAAFFLRDVVTTRESFVSNDRGTIVGVNLACDMPDVRYARGDSNNFLDAIASAITLVCQFVPDAQFRMFAHVFSDYAILADLLDRLPDTIRREAVEVYGCAPNNRGALATAAGYADCSMVIGTRFHSNVVPIGHGVPSVGLDTYPQVRRLFNDLGLSDWCIDGHDTENLAESLVATTRSILESLDSAGTRVANVRQILGVRRAAAAKALQDWLSTNHIAD